MQQHLDLSLFDLPRHSLLKQSNWLLTANYPKFVDEKSVFQLSIINSVLLCVRVIVGSKTKLLTRIVLSKIHCGINYCMKHVNHSIVNVY